MTVRKPPVYHCSFCGKPDSEVKHLIAGPTAFICGECVAVCNKIIADREADAGPIREPTKNS